MPLRESSSRGIPQPSQLQGNVVIPGVGLRFGILAEAGAKIDAWFPVPR